jgi:predicted ATPase
LVVRIPSGTVTFLFTDVEGSTRLLRELGEEEYANALAEHRRIVGARGGIEVDTQGDAFFVAFATAPSALEAATAIREELARGPIRIRAGLHTGTPLLTDEGYVGHDVHRAARIAAAGYGGQILVSSATWALIEADGLRDLGQHRLKDLSAPERIYQVGGDEFPPLKSLYQTNLPIPATPFLGREKELGEVMALVTRDDVRLLTLTGPGGTGKTRLGAQAAGAVGDRYLHGVWWIPLAPLRDPALVLEAAARALGAEDGLADHIGDKSMMLLFDNFEQVVDAAPELAVLLGSCSNLDLLVTSREPLHVSGEHEYAVPPLVHEEGVGFFLARARAIEAGFEADDAVSEICRRLDDLPLALELAAARVKALTSEQILERLDQRLPLLTGGPRDLPQRQRTLRATIEWSYELLTPEEQQLFAQLAVVRGGCTLEVAEQVAAADLDTVQSLVNKSLVRHTRGRYWMLETIREFAEDVLERSGDADGVKRRHAEHFLAVAESANADFRGGAKEWLEALAAEHDNLRAALDTFESAGETQLVLRLAGSLWRFWNIRAHFAEGARRLELAIAADDRPTAARAKALDGATAMALDLDDPVMARGYAEEALEIHRALNDEWGIANSLLILGNVEMHVQDFEAGRALFAEALERFTELGDDHYILLSMRVLAWAHYDLGDGPRARALHEEVVARARASGNRRMQQTSLGALAEYALNEGRASEAVAMLDEAYKINQELGEIREIAVNLARFAFALALASELEGAAVLLGASTALHDQIGVVVYPWALKMNEETRARIAKEIEDEAFAAAFERGRTMSADEAVALAREAFAGN